LVKLAESKNFPTVFWEIANAAVGKPWQLLPGAVKDTEGNDTVGNLKATNVVNAYYVVFSVNAFISRNTRYSVTNLLNPSECVIINYVAKFKKKRENKDWDALG
jgi:hypothetical protein